jgi:hypothetical protein
MKKDLAELAKLSVVAASLFTVFGFFAVTVVSLLVRYGNWLLGIR